MLHASRQADSIASIVSFLAEEGVARAVARAGSVLVQLFWNGIEKEELDEAVSRAMGLAPGAAVVGCSTAGQIGNGTIRDRGIAISLSCFEQVSLKPFFLEAGAGVEEGVGRSAVATFADVPDLKAILLFAPTMGIDAAALVRGMEGLPPSVALFGAGAVTGLDGCSGVLLGREFSPRGVAALGLAGKGLQVDLGLLTGWRPLGPSMRLSEADSGRIRGIDGRPAFEHYRKTLGMEDGDDLQLAEFPLLFERGGSLVARNPIALESDGSIRVIADVATGDRARLGYLDMAGLREGLQAALDRIRGFSPQAIYLYSCVCRRYALQEETEMETRPFQDIAPTAGALTAGEFCHLDGRPQLLNFSELAVALREGPPSPPLHPGVRDEGESPPNPSSERHARLTSHLISFISTLSEELGSEVAERKRAEDEARAVAEEKARLLKELQHRIKNSMALISSMASIEARTARSPEARDSLMRLEARIAALASLYELLYTTGSIEKIALSDYLGRVVDFAAKGLGAAERGIRVERDIEPLDLDVKRAIPLGLLVNELITDSVKHAFPGRRKGRIEVRLSLREGLLVLLVRDDGIGLPAGLDLEASQGFGLSLAKSLAAQLDASFSARSEGGAVFELLMPL